MYVLSLVLLLYFFLVKGCLHDVCPDITTPWWDEICNFSEDHFLCVFPHCRIKVGGFQGVIMVQSDVEAEVLQLAQQEESDQLASFSSVV